MTQFKIPTETVTLPSKGLLYAKDNVLSSGEIEMKYMTAKEEDILTNQSYIQKGTVLNNTIGATLKMIKADAEITFPDFLEARLKLTFASDEIPYEVAMSVYSSNYSASKAARNDFQHVLNGKIYEFANQTYKPNYNLWLYNEVLLGRINYPELLEAYNKQDYIMIEALTGCKFTGVDVGDIDPLKTVKALRLAIGDDVTPLMTYETATEKASQDDYVEVQKQVTKERENAAEPLEPAEPINITEE